MVLRSFTCANQLNKICCYLSNIAWAYASASAAILAACYRLGSVMSSSLLALTHLALAPPSSTEQGSVSARAQAPGTRTLRLSWLMSRSASAALLMLGSRMRTTRRAGPDASAATSSRLCSGAGRDADWSAVPAAGPTTLGGNKSGLVNSQPPR